ncbi:MAG: hypothetical protein JJU12_00255 [Chlamydiales bacterium]|nr:hypothetical protein [Chlamydiales bacterium]
MKKRDLTTLAMIGISAGLIAGGCQQREKDKRENGNHHNNHNGELHAAEHMNADIQKFYESLSPEAKKKFDQLDARHKQMAMEMAHQQCNGKNKCAGMGGCATAEHNCAGQNSCKGEGGPALKDPNKAIEIQYKNQMGKNNAAPKNNKNK